MRTTNGEEEKKTQAHQITVKSLDSLSFRSFMDMNQHSWGIKDLESRFVYMNQVALDVCNIPAGFNVEGRLDSDCPADWAEFAPEFQKQDRETEKNKKTVAVISTQYYGKEKSLNPYLFDPTAWSANPAVQGGEERLSGYERLKREWPECVRCVEASPFPHSGW